MGRHKNIDTPETMYELFTKYKGWVVNNPINKHVFVGKDGDSKYQLIERPLTYEGFCNYLYEDGIIKDPEHYFMNYQDRYKDFIGVCSRIKRVIRQNQIDGGMAGIYNPSITQRLNNLVEKTETVSTQDIKIESHSKEEEERNRKALDNLSE